MVCVCVCVCVCVQVPEHTSHFLGVIPHQRLVHKLFGIDKEGIMEVDPNTGKVCIQPYRAYSTVNALFLQVNFTHRYVDVYQWKVDDKGKSFQLVRVVSCA